MRFLLFFSIKFYGMDDKYGSQIRKKRNVSANSYKFMVINVFMGVTILVLNIEEGMKTV